MRIKRLLDEAFTYEWGPLAVAWVVVLVTLWVVLFAKILVGAGCVDAVNGIPAVVKVPLTGIAAAVALVRLAK